MLIKAARFALAPVGLRLDRGCTMNIPDSQMLALAMEANLSREKFRQKALAISAGLARQKLFHRR